MLHEIILSLSGHPSPLLTNASTTTTSHISPSERALLASVAHLSDLHRKLIDASAHISSTHASSICRAVATGIDSIFLTQFQKNVLLVEENILRKDAGSVGAYNIVPLTAIVGELSEWVRRLEWLREVTQHMEKDTCTGAWVIDKLRDESRTGYTDIADSALKLIKVAQTAWLRQASSWILYGRLPSTGQQDFFVQESSDEFKAIKALLPGFVSESASASILFIGRSLHRIRRTAAAPAADTDSLTSKHLLLLSNLKYPIATSTFTGVISSIRLSLSQTTLQQLLPPARIREALAMFYDFFLLARGDFAISIIVEANEKVRSRWRRMENLSYEKRDRLGDMVIKQGEVSAVLVRTWAALSSAQAMADEDDKLELAKELLNLKIAKYPVPIATLQSETAIADTQLDLVSTPFNDLLLPVPTLLTFTIPSPLDLFLSSHNVHIYSTINAYLLSIRRAHLRLTELWKITPLRRHHPPRPTSLQVGTSTRIAITKKLRDRVKRRSQILRTIWATSSAALFLLRETESYFHGEVIKGSWEGLERWLSPSPSPDPIPKPENVADDIWTSEAVEQTIPTTQQSYDPQTLSIAHDRYLAYLARHLLLTTQSFTESLYKLLHKIDLLVALMHRIHTIWQSLDLEADEGVVDAFSDYHKEQGDVQNDLLSAATMVKSAMYDVVDKLRDVDLERDESDQIVAETDMLELGDNSAYRPARVGRVDRLLLKLDFGTWFEAEGASGMPRDGDEEGNSSDD